MLSIILILLLLFFILQTLIKVMIYGKGVLRPDFSRVDEKLTAQTGFHHKWNSPLGRSLYYILLTALIAVTALLTIKTTSSCVRGNNIKPSAKDNSAESVKFGDPFIMLYDDIYYAYGTRAADGIEVYSSTDLKEWKKAPDLALHKDDSYGEKWFWAPEVYYLNNKFYLYYSVEEHISVATADSPLGPFKQTVQQPMLTGEKAIDNSLFIDDDAIPYLFFCRFNDGLNIWVAELEEDLTTIKTETLHQCIHLSQEWEKVWPKVNEGPFVIKNRGIYYMTYSANSYESPFYGIGCATATEIFGKWEKYPENPILQKPGNLVGVGHSAMFRDKKGDLRIVFHSHNDNNKIHPRVMHIGRAGFKNVNGVDKLYIEPDYETPIAIATN